MKNEDDLNKNDEDDLKKMKNEDDLKFFLN